MGLFRTYDFVTERLAVGGEIRTPEDAEKLIIGHGITHVLNCADNANDDMFLTHVLNKPADVTCLENPIDDSEPRKPKPVSWFATSLAFAMPALSLPGTRLYVHCKEGLNRGPVTAYAILLAWGLRPEEAESRIRLARPQVELHYMRDAEAAVKALRYT